MDGAKGSALEWALALLQAPGERHLLRQRPLPHGMEPLLAIAAGAAPETLAQAMATFGESEARLREAAQFYAREVLFFPQADAYRMLGVEADAPFERIKAHHRLLQSWLHPDRPHSEEDAAFAARVNAAWNRLRSPERRREYDETLRRAGPPEEVDSGSRPVRAPGWRPVPEPAIVDAPWRRRLPILALLALCLVLAVLAVRDMSNDPDVWEEPAPASRAPTPSAPDEAGLTLTLPRALPPSPPTIAARRAADAMPRRPVHATPRAAAQPAPERASWRPVPTVGADRPAVASAGSAPASARAAGAMASGGDAAAAPRPTSVTAPAPLPSAPSSPPVAANTGQPMPAPPIASPAPSATPAFAAEDDASPDFARLQAARQTGELLLRFLQSPNRASPPIWNSPRVEDEAEQLRRRLHAGGRVRLSQARWQIGNDSAELGSAVAVTGSTPAAGQLLARLHWRDGYWLVTGIHLEEAP